MRGPSQTVDGLTWWPVQVTLANRRTVDEWAAQAVGGTTLLSAAAPERLSSEELKEWLTRVVTNVIHQRRASMNINGKHYIQQFLAAVQVGQVTNDAAADRACVSKRQKWPTANCTGV